MSKVLVILPNNLGDVIMALPVLEGLKRSDPRADISFLVETGFEGGLCFSPYCTTVIRFNRSEMKELLCGPDWRRGLEQSKEFIGGLQSARFDRVINLCQHTYIPFLIAQLNPSDSTGQIYLREGNNALPDAWSQYLYAIPYSRRFNHLHATDIYRRIAGVSRISPSDFFSVSATQKQNAQEYLASKHPDLGNKIMAFQPGASYPAKRWQMEKFVALGQKLIHDKWQILITGAPSEKDIASGIALQLGNQCIAVAGETDFQTSIAMVSCTQGCVTGDTAIMHAAAGCGIPTYALFGPTNPVETGPYGEGHTIFAGRCANRPCFCFECKTKLCMKSIVPDDVLAAINGKVLSAPQCDIYRTSFDRFGALSLVPLHELGNPYYSKSGSWLTRGFFENEYVCDAPGNDLETAILETRGFLEILEHMAGALADSSDGDLVGLIGEFERHREDMKRFTGIGAFWAALLNIRLNSVPLLDPVKGIALSRSVCSELFHALSARVRTFP